MKLWTFSAKFGELSCKNWTSFKKTLKLHLAFLLSLITRTDLMEILVPNFVSHSKAAIAKGRAPIILLLLR